MQIKENYNHTIYACYLGFITQAIVINFAPLLYITFSREFSLSLGKITVITTLNFLIQLLVDLISAWVIDGIGFRRAAILAHLFCAAGLCGLAFLPAVIDAYAGILAAVVLYSIGAGLLEVIVTPIVEACPTEKKEAAMSLLHSFYCWGQVLVVLVSTVFFVLFGVSGWRVLAVLWAVIPLFNCLYFSRVPIFSITGGHAPMSIRGLFSQKIFWLFLLIVACAGASEHAMSQWASAFAESALHIQKTTGDLMGPALFAVFMGTARALYGKFSERLPMHKTMTVCAAAATVMYLIAACAPHPAISLFGCALTGFFVGIFWPGTFSLASARLPAAGTAMYALMALAGDIGCTGGPTLVGLSANATGGDLRRGFLLAAVFPFIIFIATLWLGQRKRETAI